MRRPVFPLWILATALLGGCGKKQDTPPAPPVTPEAPSAATQPEPIESATPTVVFRFPNIFDDPQPLQQLLDQFQTNHPNIKIQAEPLPVDQTSQNYLQALAAKPAAADVVMIDMTWLASFAEAGQLRDLTDTWPQTERQDYLPGTLAAAEYMGRTYALPWTADAGVIFYRTDLLEHHPAAPPNSWGDLTRVATEIQRAHPGLHGFVWPVTAGEDMVCATLEFLHGNGGHILNRSKAVINSPANGYGLSFAANLISRYKITPAPAEAASTPETAFAEGKAVFIRSWASAWPGLEKALPGRVGMTMMPEFPAQKPAPVLSGWQLAVAAKSAQPNASLLLVKYLCSPEAQKALALAYPIHPVVQSIYSHYELQQQRPQLARLLPSLRLARPRPVSAYYPSVSKLLQEAFAKVFRGEATAEQVLPTLQEELTRLQAGPSLL